MTTETIPLNITRHIYDGTPETLPPLKHINRISAACIVFLGGQRLPTRSCLVKDGEDFFWSVGEDIYPPLPGDIWFYACELDPILTATSTDVSTEEEEWRSTSFVPDKKRKVVVRRAHYGDEIKGNVFWVRENGSVLSEMYLKNGSGRTYIGDDDEWRYAKEGE